MVAPVTKARTEPYNLRSSGSNQQPKSSPGDGMKKRKSAMVAEPKPEPKKMINKPKSKEPRKTYDEMTEDEKVALCKKRTREIFGKRGDPFREPPKENFKKYRDHNVKLAKLAVAGYNNSHRESPEYKLVRGIDHGIMGLSRRLVFHVNFEARIKTIPDAPVELFFAEIQITSAGQTVSRCEKLGLADDQDIRHQTEQCDCEDGIKHPRDGKFLNGRD